MALHLEEKWREERIANISATLAAGRPKGPRHAIDLLRTAMWHEHLRLSTGDADPHALFKRTLPHVDEDSKKYAKYARGKHAARLSTAEQVERLIPGSLAVFEHPITNALDTAARIGWRKTHYLAKLNLAAQKAVFFRERLKSGIHSLRSCTNRMLFRLECYADLDSLTAQIVLFRSELENEDPDFLLAWSMALSLQQVLLVVCATVPGCLYAAELGLVVHRLILSQANLAGCTLNFDLDEFEREAFVLREMTKARLTTAPRSITFSDMAIYILRGGFGSENAALFYPTIIGINDARDFPEPWSTRLKRRDKMKADAWRKLLVADDNVVR